MSAEERQARILAEVDRTGGVRIAQLGARLGVSDVTARRDVEALAERGLVARVRGGAMARTAGPGPARGAGLRAKAAIARSAARLVRPDEAIGILAGGITALLARELSGVPGLSVVTNAIPIADTFHHEGRADQMVLLLGGVRTRSGALAGPVAERAAAGLNVDVVFVSVSGMDASSGFTAPGRAEARIGAALIAAARRVVVLADHGTWGSSGAAVIAPLERADVVVTDDGLVRAGRSALRRRAGRLIVADVP
ncbi:DeoR/GlpR family DNA-binding transcription regulator [Paractinoplanes atraurantiacus]|uniref:DNA-binding transcriptional regulator of sugar metabolism, DeoR/GlpR family n=1 Tax=Paractinoplanes atraurantiacus TaxID=1036182 RepID=A0A285KJD7_9ACTN|nr:DeoR/GlpR family DNA-binding transcription regulator [Actinoplanes atraurantiacus]SNY72343.1 DNA-binding transcriptional regulator of sugar metabolism, DeoR/GlpR family [Actinoplanes atraurantiacus]